MWRSGATSVQMLLPDVNQLKSSTFSFPLVPVTIASVPDVIDYVRPQLLPMHRHCGDRGNRVAAVVLSYSLTEPRPRFTGVSSRYGGQNRPRCEYISYRSQIE